MPFSLLARGIDCSGKKHATTMLPEHPFASHDHTQGGQNQPDSPNRRVSDHLANERTFLAWIRTGLATITFGFVVARFGLFLREIGIHTQTVISSQNHFSSLIGIALVLLGVGMIVMALHNFFQVRRAIDADQFRPTTLSLCVLTILSVAIGLLLALYLFLAIY